MLRGGRRALRKVQATSHTSTNDRPPSSAQLQNSGNACISIGFNGFWEDVRLRGGGRYVAGKFKRPHTHQPMIIRNDHPEFSMCTHLEFHCKYQLNEGGSIRIHAK